MSDINLNDAEYDGGKAIFNGGQAGVADNVTLTVTKKASDDTSKAPDCNLVFADSAGSEIKRAFWYLDPNSEYFDKNIKRDGKVCKHLLMLLMGENFTIPNFTDHIAMLDQTMELVRKNCENKNFAVFCNFGTPTHPNEYLNVRKFVPFITKAGAQEPMVETPYDQMSRPQATQAVSEDNYSTTAAGQPPVNNW